MPRSIGNGPKESVKETAGSNDRTLGSRLDRAGERERGREIQRWRSWGSSDKGSGTRTAIYTAPPAGKFQQAGGHE